MQKLVGVKIYRNLIFNVSSLCGKARKRLSVLARLTNLLSIKQRSLNQSLYRITVWLFPFDKDIRW